MTDAAEQDMDLVQTTGLEDEPEAEHDLLDDLAGQPDQDLLNDPLEDLVPAHPLDHDNEDLVPSLELAAPHYDHHQPGPDEAVDDHNYDNHQPGPDEAVDDQNYLEDQLQPEPADHDDLAGLGLGLDEDEAPAEPHEQQHGHREHGQNDLGADDHAALFAQAGDAEPDMAHHSEAEEEIEEPARKKEGDERREMMEQIGVLVAKMDQAVDADQADILAGKPGLRKLKVLREIDAAVARVKMHSLLLKTGFVGLLKAFLEPLKTPKKRVGADGRPTNTMALPHHKVRETVYRALQRLPIDTHEQESRDMIKNSSIGPVLRFYAKVKQETPANRRLVSDILNGWMLPIVEEGRKSVRDIEAESYKREEAVRDLKRRRQSERALEEREAKRMASQQQGMKVGDAGYQYHARVPRANWADYVKAPAIPEHIRRLEQDKVEKDKGTRDKIKKATLALQRANKIGAVRSTKVELSSKSVGQEII